ncbi:hypothetical protein QAD02_010225 [Eretmocerus hayati]|uniref:Uncharacterized protein n=1 Tax=Eretmocerus hayati TaxID=131215 RepID=A0ACC2NE54_9HYME|nr:hypothetical protein QAD02_010225 [Eretmocerus hayati]
MEKKHLIEVLLSYQHKNDRNTDELSHLHVACMINRVDVIRKLIMSDDGECINLAVSVHSIIWPGYTPLHFAVHFDCAESVQYLLRCGADITIQDPRGLTPLHLADLHRNETLIDLLLEAHEYVLKNPVSLQGTSHFHIACTRDNISVVKHFLKSGVDINLTGRISSTWGNAKPIHFAMYYGCSKVMKFFLEVGVRLHHFSQFRNLLNHIIMEKNDNVSDAFISAERRTFIPSQKYPTEMTVLHSAWSVFESIRSLESSLDNSVDFNALNASGSTPLHVAAMHKSSYFFNQFLLDRGSDVSIKDLKGDTPIHIAFKYGSRETFDLISSKLANQIENLTNEEGLSIFHMLCTTKRLDAIENFLQDGVDINTQVKSDSMRWAGFAAIHFACLFQQKEVVALLLMYGADVSVENGINLRPSDMLINNLDLYKVYKQHEAFKCLVKIFISFPDKFSNRKISPLHAVCVNEIKDLEDMRQCLMSNQGEINNTIQLPESRVYHKCTPLHLAMVFRNFTQAKLLLENGANPFAVNDEGKTPLEFMRCYQIYSGKELSEAESLLTLGQPISSLSHIRIACSFGKINAIKCMLSNITNEDLKLSFVNQIDEQRRTLLHLVLESRSSSSDIAEVVSLLLENGANVKARDFELKTPLHYAYQNDHMDVAKLLINHGADINAQNIYGETPLHIVCWATSEGETEEQILCLLENGADINLMNEWAQTCMAFLNPTEADDDGYENSYAKMIIVHFLKHVKKLEVIGRHINVKNLEDYSELSNVLYDDEIYFEEDFIRKCREELQTMENVIIYHSITLRDILYKTFDTMTICENPRLRNIIESDDFTERYPIYGYLIKLEIKYGRSRRSLVNECANSLMSLLGITIPHVCAEAILRYLSDEDLEIIKSPEKNEV